MKKNNQKNYEVRIEVPFHDLDSFQIVWHGNYLKYFEVARSALFDQLGVDLYANYTNTNYIYPIIKTSTKHIFPLKHRDNIICKATLVDVNIKIIMDFEIRLASDDMVCTRGRSEQVAIKVPEMETMFKIPDEIRKAMGF